MRWLLSSTPHQLEVGIIFIRERFAAMNMMWLRTVWAVAAVAIMAAAATDTARARTSFDGSWTVQIMTQRGTCDPSSSFGVEIHDGVVSGSGGMPIHGRVSGGGAVSVSVASGSSNASGSGRLSAISGGGSWHGVGSRGVCTGQWSASRR
jgi:hypothetical protein